ncbi:glycosyltransferase family 87 protein [Methylobacterium soli]|nr:glycosyltransferase family 87 protein [Methylobacterium soli]
MLRAQQWLRENPGQDVYQALFFEQGIKFQYPTTSLFYTELQSIIAGSAAVQSLNITNALLFLLAVVGMVLLTLGLVEHTRPSDTKREVRERIGIGFAAAIGTLCFYPLQRAWALGQIQILLDVLFIFSCYAFLHGRSATSGFLLGASALIKPQMALFLIWGLLRRDKTFVAGWILPVGFGLTASILAYGHAWIGGYIHVLSFISSHGESYFANQSANGLMYRLLDLGPNLIWDARGFAPPDFRVRIVTLLSSIMIISMALVLAARDSSREGGLVSLIVAGGCFTMASPIAWEHHYGVLLPAFAFCFATLHAREKQTGAALWPFRITLATTFIVSANALPFLNYFAKTSLNPIQSYLFFTAIVTLTLTYMLASRSRIQINDLAFRRARFGP